MCLTIVSGKCWWLISWLVGLSLFRFICLSSRLVELIVVVFWFVGRALLANYWPVFLTSLSSWRHHRVAIFSLFLGPMYISYFNIAIKSTEEERWNRFSQYLARFFLCLVVSLICLPFYVLRFSSVCLPRRHADDITFVWQFRTLSIDALQWNRMQVYGWSRKTGTPFVKLELTVPPSISIQMGSNWRFQTRLTWKPLENLI